MADLLTKETKALQSIQRLKLMAQRDTFGEKTQRMLELMSEPQRWQLSSGSVAQVQTPASTRAKELLELYQKVSAPFAATDERLDILLHLKVRYHCITSYCNMRLLYAEYSYAVYLSLHWAQTSLACCLSHYSSYILNNSSDFIFYVFVCVFVPAVDGA
jgi:hypothetical protein